MRRALLLFALLTGCPSTPLVPLAPGECSFYVRGGLCSSGPCSLVVPVGAVTETVRVDLQAVPAPAGLDEAAGGFLCRLGPPEVSFLAPVELRIHYEDEQIPSGLELEDLTGFTVRPGGAVAPAAGSTADPIFGRISIPVRGAALAGATFLPRDVDLVAELGKVAFEIDDPASYLRNLSSQLFRGVFFDGTRFYLGNGGRLLIWNDGVPASPFTPPDVVLGVPDLVASPGAPSAASFSGRVDDIWSDGTRLVVSEGHRVLIWRAIPTESYTPADLVLGQEGFDGGASNAGNDTPSATTFFEANELTSDGRRLLVADTSNHRVLVWNTFPSFSGQPADLVIGQEAFDRRIIRGGATPVYQPRGIYLDDQRAVISSVFGCGCAFGLNDISATSNPEADFSVGRVGSVNRVGPSDFAQPGAMSRFGARGFALRDGLGLRVSVWRAFPATDTTPPDLVVGKPDFTVGGDGITGISASGLSRGEGPEGGIYADTERLIVADGPRVLVWSPLPEHNFVPADLVFGQPGFTTAEVAIDYRSIDRSSVSFPRHLTSAGDTYAIADEGNNRVLLITPSRTIVLGQPDERGFTPNHGFGAPAADTLNGPSSVLIDGGRLLIADRGNHRVLLWRSLPDRDGQPADLVIGQNDFTSGRPNRGAGDADGDGDADASASSLHSPSALLIRDGRLYIADTWNHRVVIHDAIPTASGRPASRALGQRDLNANNPNHGRSWFERGADGLAQPSALAMTESGTLFVADRENNRVVGYSAVLSNGAVADLVLGQAALNTNDTPNFAAPNGPTFGLAIPETMWPVTASTLRRPEGLAMLGDRLLVADTGNHRVVAFDPPFDRAPASATALLGQAALDERSSNATGVSAASLSGPTGLSIQNGRISISDTRNHRVLTFPSNALEPNGPRDASEVFGQVDFIAHGANKSAGSPGLLARPSGVAWDGARLWLADREHHRVLVYDGDQPALALGQVDLTRSTANAGHAAAADTLNRPSDVYADGTRLIVADSANHRVLIWRTPPTRSGAPADVVIGQPNFDSAAENAGRGFTASADSLRSPEGVHYEAGRIYVADTGNNRVLIFDEPIPATGARATRVLCQATFSENLSNRGGAAAAANTCASPKDMTVAEGKLWVADSLNNRVLAFFGREDGEAATLVIGQSDATSRRSAPPSATTLVSPTSITYDGQNLLIADTGNHRVLVYASPPDDSGAAADRAIGQRNLNTGTATPNDDGLSSPARVASVPLPFNSSRIYVADSNKNRVAVFEGLARVDPD